MVGITANRGPSCYYPEDEEDYSYTEIEELEIETGEENKHIEDIMTEIVVKCQSMFLIC